VSNPNFAKKEKRKKKAAAAAEEEEEEEQSSIMNLSSGFHHKVPLTEAQSAMNSGASGRSQHRVLCMLVAE
jgi:tagatose-1,6-bisphosphate aldolase